MINDRDMPTWRFITLKKKLGVGAVEKIKLKIKKYLFLSGISMNIQKKGKKHVKNIYIFFTCSLNMLCPSQRLKGICSNHNPRSIRLYNEMTIKRRK
jgi:hypothetical protein